MNITNEEFENHTQMLIKKSEDEMRLVKSQTPEENKEMFFNEMKSYLTKENTLYSFLKKMDFEYANMDEVEYLVIEIDPMTRDALKDAQSLARLKTIIQKDTGDLRNDEDISVAQIIEEIVDGEINHGGALEDRRDNLLSEYWDYVYQNTGDGIDEFEKIESLRQDLNKSYENNDFILNSSSFEYIWRNVEDRRIMSEEKRNG